MAEILAHTSDIDRTKAATGRAVSLGAGGVVAPLHPEKPGELHHLPRGDLDSFMDAQGTGIVRTSRGAGHTSFRDKGMPTERVGITA